MEEKPKKEFKFDETVKSILDKVVKVITNPVGFFKEMPKTGGLIDPLIFMVAMGVIAGLLQSLFSLFGLGCAGSFCMAFASVIIVPILVAVFGFVGAAILFIIWKIMGSEEEFETAYRCAAYAAAISPITTILNLLPYIGGIIGIAWMLYLLVIASTEVHSIPPKKAWIVLGIIFGLFALLSLSSQIAARRAMKAFEHMEKNMEEMTPEEAGEVFGQFLKGMEKGTKEEGK